MGIVNQLQFLFSADCFMNYNNRQNEITSMKQILEYCSDKEHISPITDANTGEVCCSNCGVVINEKTIDRTRSEPSIGEEFMAKSRHGPPLKLSIPDLSKSSIISKKNSDAKGIRLDSKNSMHFSKMRFWDSRSKYGGKGKNLGKALIILDAYAGNLNIPNNAKEHAAYIYRKAVEMNLIRGSSTPAMMAASIYASCKQLGIPRSMDETSKISDVSKKKLARSYRRLVKNLKLKVDPTGVDYLSKVTNSLSVSQQVTRLADKIIVDVKKEHIHIGKNPMSVIAASVYLSAINYDEHVSLAKMSETTNISTVTIRKIIKILKPFAAKYIQSIDVAT